MRRLRQAASSAHNIASAVVCLAMCSTLWPTTRRESERYELEQLRRVGAARLRVEIAPGLPVLDADLHSLYLAARYGGYGVTGGTQAGYRTAELLTLAGGANTPPLVVRLEVTA